MEVDLCIEIHRRLDPEQAMHRFFVHTPYSLPRQHLCLWHQRKPIDRITEDDHPSRVRSPPYNFYCSAPE
jgi:hypothetical protein